MNNNINSRNADVDNLTVSDSELQYIIDNYDQFEHTTIIEQLVSVFRRNQIVLFLLILIEMSMTFFLLLVTWNKKENSIVVLQQIYRDLNSKEAALIFYTIFTLNLILNLVFYPLSFYSLVTKKLKVFKMFSVYCLYTAIMTVFIVYLNL